MADSLHPILLGRFPPREYVLMQEVSDSAGVSRSNSADYIAVNLYPSRGLAVNGIEVKSHRSDWLRELKKPDKAENIYKYCDFFWLLTDNDDVVKTVDEIPITWGWLHVKGNRILTKKQAQKLTPDAISKSFMCAMLKRAGSKDSYVHISTISEKIEEAKLHGSLNNKFALQTAENNLKRLEDRVKIFEEASGVRLGSYYPGDIKKIGESVKFVYNGGMEAQKEELEGLRRKAEMICKNLNDILNVIP